MSDQAGGKGAAAIRAAIAGAEIYRFPGGGGDDLNRVLADKERNDIGNAERFLARHGGDFLYVREVGWYYWAGTHWRADGADEMVKQRAHETARAIMEEVDALQREGPGEGVASADFRERLDHHLKWSIASGNRSKLAAMVDEAAAYLAISPEMLDADPLSLNLENGTLALEGSCGNLRAHRPEDLLAKIMNVAFDPDAECPIFQRFLADVQPDPEIRRFLQLWTGYAITGVTAEQKLVFHFGEGGNGKSVFIDLIARMLGPYAVSLPFASLLRDDRKRGGDATPDLARLPGARFVRASEPEKGARFAEATIKSITGGEEITARYLNHGFFDFTPQFKLTLSGNHRPSIRGQDRGIWRRILLVPWEVNIPDADQDKGLPAKLWAERSGVLNWILDGVRMWLEDGLYVPARVRAATDDYRSDSDPLGRFISDCIARADGEGVAAAEMYDAYKAWCLLNAERPWTMTSFGRALPERGIERSDGRVRRYINVQLVNVPQNEAAPPPNGPEDYF